MSHIVVLSGAGISAESGLKTFRDSDGLWMGYNIEDVATPRAYMKNPQLVLDFYNMRRREIAKANPNVAHIGLAELEKRHQVTIVTQNIDDLHERAGSTNVVHLHGEIFKMRSTKNEELIAEIRTDINLGDKAPDGGQWRPHIVWFGEYPFNVDEAYTDIVNADYLIIVGTSLMIGYTLNLLSSTRDDCQIYYIDPNPSRYLDKYGKRVNYIEDIATIGVEKIVKIGRAHV